MLGWAQSIQACGHFKQSEGGVGTSRKPTSNPANENQAVSSLSVIHNAQTITLTIERQEIYPDTAPGSSQTKTPSNRQSIHGKRPQRNHADEIDSREAEIQKIRQQWQQETRELNGQLAECRKLKRELEAERIHRAAARDICASNLHDPLEGELYLKNKEIWNLTKKIYDMHKQMTFLQPQVEQARSHEQINMRDTLEVIALEIGSILTGHDPAIPFQAPPTIQDSDLQMLLGSMTTNDTEQSQTINQLNHIISKFGPEVLVGALIVAALKKWVFMSSFPGPPLRATPLLDAYREAVVVQGQCSLAQWNWWTTTKADMRRWLASTP